MSIEKNKTKEKTSEKQQIILGKKTEFPNSVNDLLEYNISNENKCKICGNKNYLIQCSKCSKYYCKDCIKQITRLNINKLKENDYICSNCQNDDILKKKRKESFSSICYICGNKCDEKNISNININSEEINNNKNNFLNKGIPLSEKEDDLINANNTNNLNWSIKICNNCQIQNNELIGKNIDKKKQLKKSSNNIIDELTNIMNKDKEETNIFNILDTKSENSSDNNININKSKGKELFDTFVMKKTEKEIKEIKENNENNEKEVVEINDKKEQKKNIQINIKNDEKKNINNINNNINNISENIENQNKLDLQNIIGNNLIIKDLNDNNINNKNLFVINKNDYINPNYNSLLNSNLVERSINTFLNINPNNQNPSTKNINAPIPNSQNINPLLFNMNNNIPSNLIDISNLNNNLNTFHDINLLNNTKNQINNLKTINSTSKFPNNNNNLGNNILSYDINQNNLNNYNNLIGLGETSNINNINNIQLNLNDNNLKQDNNKTNNLNININNNLIGVNNDIKTTLNKISEDLHSFDNNNIENNLNILNNIQTLTTTFSQIINEENNKQNNNENQKELNNLKDKGDNKNSNNKTENNQEDNKNNNNDIQNNEKYKEIINNMNLNEILNVSPSTRALINYILKVNESLKNQIKTLKMYIEIQKVFVAIIYQNIEMFIQNINQNQNQIQPQVQKSISPNKDPNNQNIQNIQNNNIISQIKDINTQNTQNNNNLIHQLNPPSQLPINTLNNLQNINPPPSSNSSSTLINSPNLNYNSPIIISPMAQLISNNNLGRGHSLFNYPGQQFKQELISNIPNIFNSRIPFPLVPQQQGINLVSNPIIGQNIPQMFPILNQMNVIGNNSINNSLQFVNNPKNNQISK